MDRAEALHERGKLSLAEKPEIDYFLGLGVLKRREGVLEKGLTSDEMRGKEEKTCVNQIALGKRGKERKAGIEGFK